MARSVYQPPKQGIAGMIIDSLIMLVLVFCALEAPAWIEEQQAAEEEPIDVLESTAAAESPEADVAAVTWEELGQNAAMQFGWEKLGIDPAGAKVIIDSRFDYTINIILLLFVVALLVFYFWYMLTKSAKEYKEVISEKFD